MADKIYVWNGKVRSSQYGDFYTLGLKMEELEKYANKGYVNIVVNKRKDPDKFGNDLAVTINEWKPEEKPKSNAQDDINAEDIPF